MSMLMTAVSVTHRGGRTRKRQISLALLVFVAIFLGTLGSYSAIGWGVLQAMTAAAVLLVPFLAGDVLASIVVTAVTVWAGLSASLIAQPGATFGSAGWTMLTVLMAMVGGGAVAAFRRRSHPEDSEVEADRPEYARNITERLSLKTEMNAARAAQLSVMPRVVPAVDGLRLAARHSTSAEVGSDYYEFFPSPGHLSVALADARLPGLSSALCVSMLKGLLLNYSARLTNPRDIADRIHRQLSAIFGDDLPLSFFFGRLDRATGEFLFATFGDVPHAVLIREGGVTSLEGEEYARLTSDTVVIYSARLAEMQNRDGAVLGDEAIRAELAGANSADPRSLADALFELAARLSRGVDTPQSWVAVAIAMAPPEAEQ